MKPGQICLGTVNFGLEYGPDSRKLSLNAIQELLIFSQENNINFFDTARGYGDSETILGSFSYLLRKSHMISKLALKSLNTVDEILNELKDSLNRLRKSKIHCVLLHDTAHCLEQSGKVKLFLDSMLRAKDLEIIETFGFSIYDLSEVVQLLDQDFQVLNLQVPENIMDRRLLDSDILSQLHSNGCVIYVRSLFLQGLLTKNDISNTQHYGAEMRAFLDQFHLSCSRIGLSPSVVAIAYFNSLTWASFAVIGCDSKKQLEENLKTLETVKLPSNFYLDFPQLPLHLVDPRRWR